MVGVAVTGRLLVVCGGLAGCVAELRSGVVVAW